MAHHSGLGHFTPLEWTCHLFSNWTIQPMHPQGPEGIDRKRGQKDTVPANGSFITGAQAAMSEKREPRPKHWLRSGCTVGPKAPGRLGQGAHATAQVRPRCSHSQQAASAPSIRRGHGKPEKALLWPPAAGGAHLTHVRRN